MATKLLPSFTAASESRRVSAHESVKALLEADIPLAKVDAPGIREFLKKWCPNGGSIPKSPTIRQRYIGPIFEEHICELQSQFRGKRVAIMMDETTDDCARHVVNVIFKYRQLIKLVAMEFAEVVNNISMGQIVATSIARFVY